jgi:CheY-like chemotaxis protein
MDVDMPLLNGYEATRQIRQEEMLRGGHTPIIAMTAHAMRGAHEECLNHGMDGYLSKPLEIEALWHELDALTRGEHAAITTPKETSGSSQLAIAKFDQLHEMLDDSQEVFDELAGLYLADAPSQREQIREALTKGDADTLRRCGHSLKGMLGVFAAERSIAAAQRVEDTAGSSASEGAVAELEFALNEFDAVLMAYKW